MSFFAKEDPYRLCDSVSRQVDKAFTLDIKNVPVNIAGIDFKGTRSESSKHTVFYPKVRQYEGGLFLPYLHKFHIPSNLLYEHVAYDSKLNPIILTNHLKPTAIGYKDHPLLPVYPFKSYKPVQKMKGDFYYMGLMNPHYGHLILESLSRYWAALKQPLLIDKATKFVFHIVGAHKDGALDYLFSGFRLPYLSALGITRDNIIIVDKPMEFERITVPQAPVAISDGDCFSSQEVVSFWRFLNEKLASAYNCSSGVGPNKIYLSRRSVKNPIQGRTLLNETEVESFFEGAGFTIVAPEELDSIEQKHFILNHARYIASHPGSGLLNSIFMKPGAHVLGLSCKPVLKYNPGLNHQIHMDIACNHKTFYYLSKLHSTNEDNLTWSVSINDIEQSLYKSDYLK